MRSESLRGWCAAILLCFVAFGGATGCKSASNSLWGMVGYEKRELLVSDVKSISEANAFVANMEKK